MRGHQSIDYQPVKLSEGWRFATPSAVTIGSFDGLHVGHQAILEQLKDSAANRALVPTLLTFSPHPREVVHPTRKVPQLTTPEERNQLLAQWGVQRVVELTFDAAVQQLSAAAFIEEVLVKRLKTIHLVVGFDHKFGKDRKGGYALLNQLAPEYGFTVEQATAVRLGGEPVSSTRIRAALAEGRVGEARQFLGRPYAISSQVVQGDQKGRTLGYPTANLDLQGIAKQLIAKGVYATTVILSDGTTHKGMLNYGRRPTVNGLRNQLEVHLLDWSGDLYGQYIEVRFWQRLRDERRFESLEALTDQLAKDEAATREALAALGL